MPRQYEWICGPFLTRPEDKRTAQVIYGQTRLIGTELTSNWAKTVHAEPENERDFYARMWPRAADWQQGLRPCTGIPREETFDNAHLRP